MYINSWMENHYSVSIAKVKLDRIETKGKEISQKVMDNMQIRSTDIQGQWELKKKDIFKRYLVMELIRLSDYHISPILRYTISHF